jgi:hypothetical protein
MSGFVRFALKMQNEANCTMSGNVRFCHFGLKMQNEAKRVPTPKVGYVAKGSWQLSAPARRCKSAKQSQDRFGRFLELPPKVFTRRYVREPSERVTAR